MSSENNLSFITFNITIIQIVYPGLDIVTPHQFRLSIFFFPKLQQSVPQCMQSSVRRKVRCIAMEVRPTVFDLARLKHVVTSGWGMKDLNPMLLLVLESHMFGQSFSTFIVSNGAKQDMILQQTPTLKGKGCQTIPICLRIPRSNGTRIRVNAFNLGQHWHLILG